MEHSDQRGKSGSWRPVHRHRERTPTMNAFSMGKIVWVLATLFPLASYAQGAAPVPLLGNGAPVPAGKVRTPSGRLVDSACVFEEPDGALVQQNGDVVVKGKVIAHHEPCTPEQMGIAPTIGHAWLEASWATASTYYTHWEGLWTVPATPLNNGATLFYFGSFENSSGTEIIQPVIGYGGNAYFGGNYWTMASWYCYPGGCHHSGAKNINPGDQIFGIID